MKLSALRTLVAVVLVVMGLAGSALAQEARYIVKFRAGRSAAGHAALRAAGAQVMLSLDQQDAAAVHIPAAALTLVKFYAHESCGKCVPCREGGTWLYRIVERIVAGEGTDADLATILEVGESICPGNMPHASSERLGLTAVRAAGR